jgi:hypothetical protein
VEISLFKALTRFIGIAATADILKFAQHHEHLKEHVNKPTHVTSMIARIQRDGDRNKDKGTNATKTDQVKT